MPVFGRVEQLVWKCADVHQLSDKMSTGFYRIASTCQLDLEVSLQLLTAPCCAFSFHGVYSSRWNMFCMLYVMPNTITHGGFSVLLPNLMLFQSEDWNANSCWVDSWELFCVLWLRSIHFCSAFCCSIQVIQCLRTEERLQQIKKCWVLQVGDWKKRRNFCTECSLLSG